MQKIKKHILIVDDVTTNLKCLGEILKDQYSITMAKSGEQALSIMKRIHPDLVMLDVKMPGLDGYETMERMLRDPATCDIPVVFLTADRDCASEIKGLRLGAKDYIRKPYEPEIMTSRINNILFQEERHRELSLSVLKDPLTGVWNREYLKKAIERFAAEGINGSFMILDLDNFKYINDNFGHVVGDEALVAFAKTLCRFVHKDDVVARIGGDEFVVFLKGSVGKSLLEDRIANLISEVEKQLSIVKKDDSHSSVSIGVSALPKDGTEFLDLYNKADKALYFVKKNGKHGFHFYDQEEKYSFPEEADASIIDLTQLKKVIDEKNMEPGPLSMDYASFRNIYQFLCRYVDRTGIKVQLLLFTLKNLSMSVSGEEGIESAMSALESSIKSSLRKNDICTSYSKSQFLVILLDVNDRDRQLVVQRVMNNWNNSNRIENVLLKYDIVAIDAGIGEE